MNITPFPPCSSKDATAAGYAEFNEQPTLCINIPDGGFTLSCKTSEGKRITFAFMPYANGGAPQCVDICYHDNGTVRHFNGKDLPTFDALLFGETGKFGPSDQHDTRRQPFKPGIVCVLMDGRSHG